MSKLSEIRKAGQKTLERLAKAKDEREKLGDAEK